MRDHQREDCCILKAFSSLWGLLYRTQKENIYSVLEGDSRAIHQAKGILSVRFSERVQQIFPSKSGEGMDKFSGDVDHCKLSILSC